MTALRIAAITLAALGLRGTSAPAGPIHGPRHSWHHGTPADPHQRLVWARLHGSAGVAPTSPNVVRPAPVQPAAPGPPRTAVSTPSLFATSPQPPARTAAALVGAPGGAAARPASAEPTFAYDAFINLGEGPYAGAAQLTSGGAEPWYLSSALQPFFGGVPDAQERDAFSRSVLEKVEAAYAGGGINLELTTDPTASAAHTLSIVSGTSFGPNPNAVGITDMGNDGFTFIDKLTYARSLDELEWAVANNVAHELMHAFGVEHQDQTGAYLDAATVSWELLAGPGAAFSPEAIAELAAVDLRTRFAPAGAYAAQGLSHAEATELIAPVPEPTTLAVWSLLGAMAIVARWGRRA